MGEEVTKMGENGPLSAKLQQPTHFVLVHGISGGSWCWYKIRCLMENSGYRVSCIDLKGAGIDPADADSVRSFDDYNKPLLDFMSSLPDNEKVLHQHIHGLLGPLTCCAYIYMTDFLIYDCS